MAGSKKFGYLKWTGGSGGLPSVYDIYLLILYSAYSVFCSIICEIILFSAPTRFKSCYDMILSRFCASNFKTFGISGVKINRIVRVHNRILRSKFEDRVQDYLDGEDSPANEYVSFISASS